MTQTTTIPENTRYFHRNRWFIHVQRLILIIAVPVLLVMGGVRLVMTELFLNIEYQRPGFTVDAYGFTQEDRLQYAPIALEYLLNGEDISFLGNQELPGEKCWPPRDSSDTCAMYNERELHHMEDVKIVTKWAFLFAVMLAIFTTLSGFLLWRHPDTHSAFRSALMQGAIITLSLIATIIVIAVAAWDVFFTGFHQIFFESGTWRFYYSDTLIRLFPEQFWFDAAVAIGVLTGVGAVGILTLTWYWGRQAYLNLPASDV